jgi:uncharacterized membrane protein
MGTVTIAIRLIVCQCGSLRIGLIRIYEAQAMASCHPNNTEVFSGTEGAVLGIGIVLLLQLVLRRLWQLRTRLLHSKDAALLIDFSLLRWQELDQ